MLPRRVCSAVDIILFYSVSLHAGMCPSKNVHWSSAYELFSAAPTKGGKAASLTSHVQQRTEQWPEPPAITVTWHTSKDKDACFSFVWGWSLTPDLDVPWAIATQWHILDSFSPSLSTSKVYRKYICVPFMAEKVWFSTGWHCHTLAWLLLG